MLVPLGKQEHFKLSMCFFLFPCVLFFCSLGLRTKYGPPVAAKPRAKSRTATAPAAELTRRSCLAVEEEWRQESVNIQTIVWVKFKQYLIVLSTIFSNIVNNIKHYYTMNNTIKIESTCIKRQKCLTNGSQFRLRSPASWYGRHHGPRLPGARLIPQRGLRELVESFIRDDQSLGELWRTINYYLITQRY